jgi:hypothetical protein
MFEQNRVASSTTKRSFFTAVMAITAASFAMALTALPVRAAGVTIAQYRLGENDPGAAAGLVGADPTLAAVGGPNLQRVGSPVYSASTPLSTSTLSMSFDGIAARYTAGTVASYLTDNFAIEAWARADSTSSVVAIAYNGDSAFGGWGLYQFGGSWAYLYGGVTVGPMVPVTVGSWTHLAVVRNAGMTTFYVNGVPVGAPEPTGPSTPVGGMAIGGNFRNASENFNGLIDEVRIFTFAPGQFQVSDLNLTPEQQLGMIAGLLAQLPVDAATLKPLTVSLTSALNSLQTGQVNAAVGKLNATANKVQALANSGRITPAEAQSVIGALNAFIATLGK